jgi:hypothetical protein
VEHEVVARAAAVLGPAPEVAQLAPAVSFSISGGPILSRHGRPCRSPWPATSSPQEHRDRLRAATPRNLPFVTFSVVSLSADYEAGTNGDVAQLVEHTTKVAAVSRPTVSRLPALLIQAGLGKVVSAASVAASSFFVSTLALVRLEPDAETDGHHPSASGSQKRHSITRTA